MSSNEGIKAGVACIEIQAGDGVPLRQVVEARVHRLKARLEAAFAMPCSTGEESRLKRIAIKRAALAIADSCDVVVSDLYKGEEKASKESVAEQERSMASMSAMLIDLKGGSQTDESPLDG